ncbi:MAG: hypothetical protein AAGD25_07425 [Cyanobacteria bacterium P01_F01_bin.150]
MQILIAYPIAEESILHEILSNNIIYRPDLLTKGSRFITSVLTENRPNILITQELPDEEVVRCWLSEMPSDSAQFIIQKHNEQQGEQPSWIAGVPVYTVLPVESIH